MVCQSGKGLLHPQDPKGVLFRCHPEPGLAQACVHTAAGGGPIAAVGVADVVE